jgi:hypothetical protein
MQFKIQQIALCPKDPQRAFALLEKIGLSKWTLDTVTADGKVHGQSGINTARLAFNYEAFDGNELEVLDYTHGRNWMDGHRPTVSHLGMHCTEAELAEWKELFAAEGIAIAQEVWTSEHTNPFLVQSGRRYHYCIFDTREILGTDLKFIVRREKV